MIEYWEGDAYPDFVAEGTGDQSAINAAICAVKKASYNGIDCVGGDDTATGPTGTVSKFGEDCLLPGCAKLGLKLCASLFDLVDEGLLVFSFV